MRPPSPRNRRRDKAARLPGRWRHLGARRDRRPELIGMSVPGDLDDGSDTSWHIYDLDARRGRKVGNGEDARRAAEREAHGGAK